VLVYYPHELVLGRPSEPVEVPGETKQPARVWTMFQYRDPETPPTLPVVPFHGKNAWLEDIIHDWKWVSRPEGCVLRYYTRAMPGKVWLLLEFET
jgi:hypothetical protein